jgi:uncharacterized protein YegL
MRGDKLARLQEGLFMIEGDVKGKKLVSLRAEIAIVTFNSAVELISDFTLGKEFSAPQAFRATGKTLIATAIVTALEMLEARKAYYRSQRLNYFRPLLAVISDGLSDGESPDLFDEARARLAEAVSKKQVQVFSFGVPGVDSEQLESLTGVAPMVVDLNTNWQSMFKFISNSIDAASRAHPR